MPPCLPLLSGHCMIGARQGRGAAGAAAAG